MSDNPPAFPVMFNDGHICAHEIGITLRDYFAAAALQGDVASGYEYNKLSDLAERAYKVSDAMLAQRNKQ